MLIMSNNVTSFLAQTINGLCTRYCGTDSKLQAVGKEGRSACGILLNGTDVSSVICHYILLRVIKYLPLSAHLIKHFCDILDAVGERYMTRINSFPTMPVGHF